MILIRYSIRLRLDLSFWQTSKFAGRESKRGSMWNMWNKEHPDTSELLISIFIARGNILISGTDKENREKMRSFHRGTEEREEAA